MKKLFSFLIVFNVAFGCQAQDHLSLADMRDSILLNHPSLKMLESNRKSSDAAAEGAFSWMPPEIGAGLFQAPYNIGRWKGKPGMPGMGMFMVSAEQMFPNRKAQNTRYEFLRSKGNIELEKKSGIVNELFSKARNAYYNLVVIEKKAALIAQNEKLLDFMIQSTEIRYKNNLGNINSYYKLKAALAKLKTRESVLEANKNAEQITINNIIFRNDQLPVKVDTVFHWYAFENLGDGNNHLEQTSAYRVLDKTIATNKLEQQSELSALKPEFGIRYEHMVGFGHQPQMFSLMAMMKFPLANWSSRMNRANAESLLYYNESLKSQQLAYLNEARGNSNSLFAELSGIKNELKMYDAEIIPALLKNFQTLQISYEQNNAGIFELFDAWQSLLNARMDYLDSLQRAMQVQAELMKIFEIIE